MHELEINKKNHNRDLIDVSAKKLPCLVFQCYFPICGIGLQSLNSHLILFAYIIFSYIYFHPIEYNPITEMDTTASDIHNGEQNNNAKLFRT